jgi:mannitol/fructose-specific phosphotransferase system IIA component (Ntr-type)
MLPETVSLRVAAKDWVDVVHAAGNLLVVSGAVEPQYVEAMRELIEQHGPYVVIIPGVALLHAPPGRWVNRMCMSLVTLRRPVPFGHDRFDPVRMAVALGTLDDHSHWRPLRQLVELLSDQEMRERICAAETKELVLQLVGEHSHEDVTRITQFMSQSSVTQDGATEVLT